MKRRITAIVTVIVLAIAAGGNARALSLDLDSIARWGKFPRFCVNTYRWGDKFFNTYDSAYVQGTGYKFNVKTKAEAWLDNYDFILPDDYRLNMLSEVNTSLGFYVTYLAVSLGYDINIGKIFDVGTVKRNKFNFKLNCALLSADLYWITNHVGTNVLSYGRPGHRVDCNIPFTGINTNIFGLDTYYFFNNKRYSRAAAFNYSKVQMRSQGSWFLGISYWTQDFKFDFVSLPDEIKADMPKEWADNGYVFHTVNHNYAIRGGYGFNWVFHRHWALGVCESPIVGFRHGSVNGADHKTSPSLYNRFQFSTVWNNRHWFAGIVFTAENGLFVDKDQMLINGVFTTELSLGYRFNLW